MAQLQVTEPKVSKPDLPSYQYTEIPEGEVFRGKFQGHATVWLKPKRYTQTFGCSPTLPNTLIDLRTLVVFHASLSDLISYYQPVDAELIIRAQ